jgi:hypothetical protein
MNTHMFDKGGVVCESLVADGTMLREIYHRREAFGGITESIVKYNLSLNK